MTVEHTQLDQKRTIYIPDTADQAFGDALRNLRQSLQDRGGFSSVRRSTTVQPMAIMGVTMPAVLTYTIQAHGPEPAVRAFVADLSATVTQLYASAFKTLVSQKLRGG